AAALNNIDRLSPVAEAGKRFRYSDVGFIVLGELLEKLSGMPLEQFAQKHIFSPLGMDYTGLRISTRPEGLTRIAPTQTREGRWMIGEVHDPRAYSLGGVAGHAGLFSTADDLALYARMLLHGGELNGRRILTESSVRQMTTPHPVPGGLRSYGW